MKGILISSYLGFDVVRYVVQCIVTARARPPFNTPALGEQQWIKQQLCLLEIFWDVDIFMHPKHLWMLVDWKFLENKAHFLKWKSIYRTGKTLVDSIYAFR